MYDMLSYALPIICITMIFVMGIMQSFGKVKIDERKLRPGQTKESATKKVRIFGYISLGLGVVCLVLFIMILPILSKL